MIGAAPGRHRLTQALGTRPCQPERHAALIGHHRREEPVGSITREWRRDRVGKEDAIGVERHADLRIGTHPVEFSDFVGRRDAASDGHSRRTGRRNDLFRERHVGAAETPFTLDEGHQERADDVAEFNNPLEHASAGVRPPAVDHHFAIDCVECHHHALAR